MVTGITVDELKEVKRKYKGRCVRQVWKEPDGKIHVVLGRKTPQIMYFKFPVPRTATETVNNG